MAFIVLLHVAFFFALSSGLGIQLIPVHGPDITLINTDPVEQPNRKPPEIPLPNAEPASFKDRMPFVPRIENPDLPRIDTSRPDIISGPPGTGTQEVIREPVTVAPDEDRHHPLSAPAYPAAEIRANHAGIVILRVQVLEDGSIGNVELAHSSGYARLDESAMREARHWRMKPGTRDGVPVVMWKEVPITFQLKDRGTTDF
jgi:protein TonB